MKIKTIKTEIARLSNEIIKEIERWIYIGENGCSDPSWCDGFNMNLVRNHIIYDKGKIAEICQEKGIEFPNEYYIPTPPIVSNYYMSDLKCKRALRFKKEGYKLTNRHQEYNQNQLSFL